MGGFAAVSAGRRVGRSSLRSTSALDKTLFMTEKVTSEAERPLSDPDRPLFATEKLVSVLKPALVSLEIGYRKQVGQQIDLNLLTGRVQFSTVVRQIFIKVGVDLYRRDYLHERTNFMGGFIQIVRNFNWHKR